MNGSIITYKSEFGKFISYLVNNKLPNTISLTYPSIYAIE